MSSFEDAIEQYKKELIEFSKQNPYGFSEIPVVEEIEPEAEPVLATVADDFQVTKRGPYSNYDDFVKQNSSMGKMKVQVTTGGAIPLSNVKVNISVDLPEGEKELFNGFTNIDGIVDDITLPAPPSSLSLNENETVEPYAIYTVRVSHPDFSTAEFKRVPVFEQVKSIQSVNLVPLTNNATTPGEQIFSDQPMTLYGGET